MQKILVLCSVITLHCYYLYGISVREYVQEYGVPSVKYNTLDLSHKNITNLEGLEDIPNSNSIQVLNLARNNIQTLPAAAFSCFPQLRWLHLESNDIRVLSAQVFVGLDELSILDLSNNQIDILAENIFMHLPQLQYLDVSYNQIALVQRAMFAPLSQLRWLFICHNHITLLPQDTFAYVSQLRYLYLRENNIRVLPQNIFTYTRQLVSLDLSDNKLSSLPDNIFACLDQLTYLNLHGNQLEKLDKGIFDSLYTGVLDIRGNLLKETTDQIRKKYLMHATDDLILYCKDQYQESVETIQQKLLARFLAIGSDWEKQQQEKQAIIALLQEYNKRVYYDYRYLVPLYDKQGDTVLHKAVALGNPLLVKLIVQLFPRLLSVANRHGQIPLHMVVMLKNKAVSLAMTKILLAQNEQPQVLLNMRNNKGNTPLHLALYNNNYRVLQFLLACGEGYKSGKLECVLQQPDRAHGFKQLRNLVVQRKSFWSSVLAYLRD